MICERIAGKFASIFQAIYRQKLQEIKTFSSETHDTGLLWQRKNSGCYTCRQVTTIGVYIICGLLISQVLYRRQPDLFQSREQSVLSLCDFRVESLLAKLIQVLGVVNLLLILPW